MPVPKPKKGEDKTAFIGRCIRTLTDEDPNRPPDQTQAICFTAWKGRKNQMTDIKKKINNKKDWKKLNYSVPISESFQDGNEFVINGIAINETITRNGHKFIADELRKAAPSLKDKPLLKDHWNSVDSIVGRTKTSKFDKVNKNIAFSAAVMDQTMKEMINDRRITSVSVGAIVEDLELEEKEGKEPVMIVRGLEFVELSLVAVPADPDAGFAMAVQASFDLKNKIKKKELHSNAQPKLKVEKSIKTNNSEEKLKCQKRKNMLMQKQRKKLLLKQKISLTKKLQA